MRVLGVDEAGRGCVLGDLFVGAFLAVDADDAALRAAGAADSKRLSAARREAARDALARLGEPAVARVSPAAIDAGNLNELELDAIAELVRRFQPDRVLLDALGPPRGAPAVIEKLRARVGTEADPEWLIEPKADHTYAIVGAASIFAKTARDAALAEIDRDHGPLGSGYPSDPVTRAWLAAHAATGRPWPSFVRTRWATIAEIGQLSLGWGGPG